MSLGTAIRAVLGRNLSHRVGHYYRAFFVDLEKVAQAVSAAIPPNARVLDIGGGDGEPLNYLLKRRSDLVVTTIDPAPEVGIWVDPQFATRVERLPLTTLDDLLASGRPRPDVLLLSDVVHHIPVSARPAFFASLAPLFESNPGLRLIVKDVEPGFPRARLGYWADRYVTGDRAVSPIGRADLIALVQSAVGRMRHEETALFATDAPNYAVVFFGLDAIGEVAQPVEG